MFENLSRSDLFNLPFQAEVWGTASDWLMIVITIASLWYIRNTLKSQQEVQRQQTQITEIESKRARRDIRPKVDLEFLGKEAATEIYGVKRMYALSISSSPAFEICFEFAHLPESLLYTIKFYPRHYISEAFGSINIEVNGFEDNWRMIVFKVYFKDEDGGQYERQFNISNDIVHSGRTVSTFNHPDSNIFSPRINPGKVQYIPGEQIVLSHSRTPNRTFREFH